MAATEEAVVGYKELPGNSLMLQWLGIHALSSGAPGSIPGQETKILQTTGTGKKKKKNNKELPRALRYLDGMALTMPEARDRRVLAVLGVCPEELNSPFFLVRLQPRHEPPSLCQ